MAQALADGGADVAISYERSVYRAQEVVKLVESKGRRGFAIRTDSGDASANERLVEQAVARLGGLDILANNAGTIREGSPVELSSTTSTRCGTSMSAAQSSPPGRRSRA